MSSGDSVRPEVGRFDAVVIGAGFGGLYAVHKLKNELGLDVRGYEFADGVGGTWHWNRYPGALSDTESYVYRYSFDSELLEEWSWKNRYLTQPEILAYLNHVADRYSLRDRYRFNTRVESAHFDDNQRVWRVATNRGDTVTARYLITGLGLLSAINKPDIKGIDSFSGQLLHTGRWPEDADLAGKRVGIIGTGSTGQQVITAVAPIVENLTVFQRSAQYCVPSGQGPQTAEEIADIKSRYGEIWSQVRNSAVAFGFQESAVPAMSVSEEEREKVFQEAWDAGGGFRFMFGTFSDIAVDRAANEAACAFVRKKIREIVNDPQTAEKLCPTDLYAKRPLCGKGYFETFNRENVTLVDIRANPIVEIVADGVRTSDGQRHDIDVLILATGFDAVDGNYNRMDLVGRNGLSLARKWKSGPGGYLGMMEAGFPNMFMILGPNGPFTNLPPSIETQVEWIADTIRFATEKGVSAIEVNQDRRDSWLDKCREIAGMTVFAEAESWIFGANIPGKPRTVMFYFGGLANYREELQQVVDSGYEGFTLDREAATG